MSVSAASLFILHIQHVCFFGHRPGMFQAYENHSSRRCWRTVYFRHLSAITNGVLFMLFTMWHSFLKVSSFSALQSQDMVLRLVYLWPEYLFAIFAFQPSINRDVYHAAQPRCLVLPFGLRPCASTLVTQHRIIIAHVCFAIMFCLLISACTF